MREFISGLPACGLALLLLAFAPGWSAPSLAETTGSLLEQDPSDLTVWPNQTSRANSDPWLVVNHDRIRRMNPRLLVINFANHTPASHLEGLVTNLIAALAEGSRYHGYTNSQAPVFLNYAVFKFVDLREPTNARPNSSRVPVKSAAPTEINVDYGAFFGDAFARHLGIRDPKHPVRCLRLDELVDAGYVHEVWFMGDHDENLRALECVEEKPQYDDRLVRDPTKFVQAGNGGDDGQKWTGRSVRIGFINVTRGIGCFLESLSHSIEGTAHSGAIPYFTRYFHEFGGFDLDRRYGLPWDSFYPLWGEGKGVSYPDSQTALVTDGQRSRRVTNYVAFGGNVHFPPNGRSHYDLESPDPVMSTIEDWRIGSGPGGQDLARPWTTQAFARYRQSAPDCMGPWLIYWRQNFPGLDNRQKDDAGKPMKNWWPFLFY
jgi:hypothetical protein